MVQSMKQKTWRFLPKTRSSHPVSKLLRPVLEIKKLKTALGGAMSAMSVFVGSFFLMTGVYQESRPVQAFTMSPTEMVIETEKQSYFYGFKQVVPSMSGVSQGFHGWHLGVDITAPAGSEIYPVDKGKVLRIENSRWGYGRSILVEHEGKVTSLYAHVGKVMVEEGEVIDADTLLAEIGLTGRTTGYHLHLEIRDEGRALSPARFLTKTVKLASDL
jgi:murein DD-endopeptidase MepM/ murein hydrolase activator NlpD